MLQRKMQRTIERFFEKEPSRALLVTGARQVGKTTLIRSVGRKLFPYVAEINMLENTAARQIFLGAQSAGEVLLRLSALSPVPLKKGKTLIFIDEVQECPELVTMVKFLVEEGSYRYIFSGSLLGVELKDIRSVPVGYMDCLTMYPMDFEEFALANGLSEEVRAALKRCYDEKTPVDALIHQKMLDMLKLYLIVGGMPRVAAGYVENHDLRDCIIEQRSILAAYRRDIAKYDPDEKLYLDDIFSLIPSELNSKNKRFVLKNLNEHFKFSRYSHSFLWLRDAGVALPVFSANEPKAPLILSKATNLFKLFQSDVGLLSAMYADDIQLRILSGEKSINFGAVYENYVAQELYAHGYAPYYYNNKKMGEVDFLTEEGGDVTPIEVKSGKDYQRHAALTALLSSDAHAFRRAVVLSDYNVSRQGICEYLPIYMTMFMEKALSDAPLRYAPDFSALGGRPSPSA